MPTIRRTASNGGCASRAETVAPTEMASGTAISASSQRSTLEGKISTASGNAREIPVVRVVPILVERLVHAQLAGAQPAAGELLRGIGVDVVDVRRLSLQIQDDHVEGEGGVGRRQQPVDVVLLVRDGGMA